MIKPFIKFRSRSNESIALAILDANNFLLPSRGHRFSFYMGAQLVTGKVEEIEHEIDRDNNQIVTIWIEDI